MNAGFGRMYLFIAHLYTQYYCNKLVHSPLKEFVILLQNTIATSSAKPRSVCPLASNTLLQVYNDLAWHKPPRMLIPILSLQIHYFPVIECLG